MTGAAGLVGRAVTHLLRGRGVEATALALDDPGDLAVGRVITGDAGDPATVRAALEGVEAVIHLAARPSPHHGTPEEVYLGNTRATFVVLEEAGKAGINRVMIASSYSILGIPWAPTRLHPAYYPIDEQIPLQITDAYALSKQADEATARMMARRHGMDIVAIRYPFVSNEARLAERLSETLHDPGVAAADSWAYLDVDDAAETAWHAITEPLTGFHAVFTAAPDILAPYPTQELIATYHPDTPLRRPILGRRTPIDTAAATRLLGFTPRAMTDLEERPLGAAAG
ncbi:NAD-dependent epimerase/dehydratase family protein [Streptomyces rugosispiralis]|uniref:NAD(P)-dependent oxidoreductase n=1 Tax=Streptomyces rugosispiralis TaxID=2967341 RepID=A0ABT1V5G0_9ACTN|nr:NAD(P)-dependent oxidoreductase [Streptomyces rugosispiralis]MCQ8192623.1 NAD(P)-dependent oxidoreductase [Streptomyces rugosispiralis]